MPELPTGTVTFLFTDIEGSTNLARTLGPRWREVLEEHHRILREAIRDHGGIDLRTQGDSIFAVFISAVDAVGACADAQRALAEHPWPQDGPIRVRMGMHTGEGRLGGDEYVGLDVHRAARISAAGHGGQVLISEASKALAEGGLPAGVGLRDLGTHRLKDFDEPQAIHQLVIDGLPSDFPPIETLEVPTNLPVALTTFVGRESELANLEVLLARNRLVTLVGPGGTGKTRLALEASRRQVADHRDGVFFVDLSPIRDAGLIASSIVQSLGLKERADRPALATVVDHLRDLHALLLIDNFEHVVDGASVVDEILQAAPKVTVVATSRIRLGRVGEQEFPVPPLTVPENRIDVQALAGSEAVRLFADRARAAQPSFEVSEDNAGAVAEVCARLDGLPLAIELAAAQLRVLSPKELLTRLDQRLPLRAGAANVPERQRTLRATIEWSYGLLDEPQRRLFARLSVFAGGASFGAVDEVCNPDGELGADTLEALARLIDQSLVRRLAYPSGSRFTMLETIREYAAERSREDFDAGETERRHAEFFAGFADEWGPAVRGPDARTVNDLLARDYDNIRAAIDWAVRVGEAEIGIRIGTATWKFWVEQGHIEEGRKSVDRLLELRTSEHRDSLRAGALGAAAAIAYWTTDYPEAARAYREAADIYAEIGDAGAFAEATKNLAYVALAQNDPGTATSLVDEVLETTAAGGHDAITAEALSLLGSARAQSGDLEGAVAALRESKDRFEAIPSADYWVAEVSGRLGSIFRVMGRLDEAEEYMLRSLRANRDLARNVGAVAVARQLADVALRRGDHERALRLAGFGEVMAERMGGEPPRAILMLSDISELRSVAGTTLDEETVERVWAEGRAMDADQAIAYALGES